MSCVEHGRRVSFTLPRTNGARAQDPADSTTILEAGFTFVARDRATGRVRSLARPAPLEPSHPPCPLSLRPNTAPSPMPSFPLNNQKGIPAFPSTNDTRDYSPPLLSTRLHPSVTRRPCGAGSRARVPRAASQTRLTRLWRCAGCADQHPAPGHAVARRAAGARSHPNPHCRTTATPSRMFIRQATQNIMRESGGR